MKKITWRERLHYEFDNLMARGTIALLFWLTLAGLLLIIGVALLDLFLNIAPEASLPELMWRNLLHALDPGRIEMTQNNYLLGASMLTVTFGGVFIVSTLIGILSNGISLKLEEMRKGRSLVVEKGHTIILGWTPTIFTMITELAYARERDKKCIVVLADRDKVWMENEIRAHVPHLPKTRVVCRTGNPLRVHDLSITNPDDARAILIPAPESDDPDAHVVKTILALVNRTGRRQESYHIVAELRDAENLAVARLVAGAEAEFVLSSDLLARLTAQACRQSGLSVIYSELLAFQGNEIYTLPLPQITGKSYSEARLLMDSCVLIGIETSDGRALLNPRGEFVIQERDRAIVIAPDLSEIRTRSTLPDIDHAAIATTQEATAIPERTLLLGWNRRVPELISELDEYVAPDSQVTIVSDAPHVEQTLKTIEKILAHQTLHHINSSPTNRRTLERLHVENFDHIIVPSPFDQLVPQEADARAMITLLQLRALDHQAAHNFTITSEILDPYNRELAEVAHPDDFIVSTQLVSLMLVQLAENPRNAEIFADLFSAHGMEIYLRPMNHYVQTAQPVHFYTLIEAAHRRSETAIGYRLAQDAYTPEKNYGITLNPRKEERIIWSPLDHLIVLAEN